MAEPILPDRPPGPHPTPEQLYRARRGPRTSEAERWLAHAAACAVCTEELLRQEAFDAPDAVPPRHLDAAWERFGKTAGSREEDSPLAEVIPIAPIAPPGTASRTAVRRLPWATALAAAGITAVVGLGVWTSTRAPQASHLALRGGAAAAGDRQPSGLLDAPPTEIVFPASGGDAKRVLMFDESHKYIWTSPPTTNGRVPFPAHERQRLRKGVEYFWTVVGEEGNGAPSFRLR